MDGPVSSHIRPWNTLPLSSGSMVAHNFPCQRQPLYPPQEIPEYLGSFFNLLCTEVRALGRKSRKTVRLKQYPHQPYQPVR